MDNTMNQSCKVSEHNIETEEFKIEKRKKYMREYMAKRRQLKRSECNEGPLATKVEGHDMKTQKTLLLSESKNMSKLLVEQNNQKDRRKRKHTIDNTMNQSCKVSEHNIETEEFKKGKNT